MYRNTKSWLDTFLMIFLYPGKSMQKLCRIWAMSKPESHKDLLSTTAAKGVSVWTISSKFMSSLVFRILSWISKHDSFSSCWAQGLAGNSSFL